MKNVHEYLKKASEAYYSGQPIISDEEFDSLAEASGFRQLGAPAPNAIKHYRRMYSLKKVHPGEPEPFIANPVKTPKLDGAAISILYVPNTSGMLELQQILTRGDGIRGLDITEKIRHLVPKILWGDSIPRQINAEVVAPKEIPNARNYAAGALNLKSTKEVRARDLSIIAHDVSPDLASTYEESLIRLFTYFNTVLEDFLDYYPTDGEVIRENNNKLYKEAGFTSKHPRAAYALKPKPPSAETILKDVVWQVGRTGVVAPVAILEPVKINDALISRATLHNMAYIKALGLKIGSKVEVVRAGEIIPRITKVLDEAED